MKKINKKGQEEIVGFVVVVVLVAVVFVVFLGFSFSKKDAVQEKGSKDIKQFLESVREVRSECVIGNIPINLKELLGACYDDLDCGSGKKACEELNKTSKELLEAGYHVGNESYVKGYEFNAYFEERTKEKKESIISLKEGNCSSSNYREADDFFPYANGQIFSNLRVCY